MDKEGDTKVNDTEEDQPGWCWFATFGLLDPNDITLDGLESLARGGPAYGQRGGSGCWTDYGDSL